MSTKRVRWLIYPKFQLTLVLANFSLVTICMGMFALELYRTFKDLKGIGEQASLPLNHPFFNFVNWQQNKLFMALGVAYIISVVLLALCTLILSHKLAGPVVRMKTFFDKITQTGQVSENLRFREKDFFKELPDAINSALSKINSKK